MKRLPPLWLSCVPLALLVALIACVVSIFGDETLAGASQLALLVATASCVSIGIATNLISWNEGKPKYDIRDWAPDHEKMGKGISLTKDELEALYGLIGNVLGK